MGRVSDSDILYEIEFTYNLSQDNGGESVRLGYSVGNHNHVQTKPMKMLVAFRTLGLENTHELFLEIRWALSVEVNFENHCMRTYCDCEIYSGRFRIQRKDDLITHGLKHFQYRHQKVLILEMTYLLSIYIEHLQNSLECLRAMVRTVCYGW